MQTTDDMNTFHRVYTLGRIMMLIEFYKEGKINWDDLKESIDSELIYLLDRYFV